MLEIKFMGIDAAERFHDNRKHVVISITSPGSREARLPRSPSRRDTLRVQFWDIKIPICRAQCYPTDFWAKCEVPQLHRVRKPITSEEIKPIVDFILKWYNIVDLIVVHCEAGMSRSVAIACAIADFIGHPNRGRMFEHNAGNGHVRTLVLNALMASKPEVRNA